MLKQVLGLMYPPTAMYRYKAGIDETTTDKPWHETAAALNNSHSTLITKQRRANFARQFPSFLPSPFPLPLPSFLSFPGRRFAQPAYTDKPYLNSNY